MILLERNQLNIIWRDYYNSFFVVNFLATSDDYSLYIQFCSLKQIYLIRNHYIPAFISIFQPSPLFQTLVSRSKDSYYGVKPTI